MRIYDSAGGPVDFCKKHFPNETEAFEEYGNVGLRDDGSNGYGYDTETPDYEEWGDYSCEVCGKTLKARDTR